MTSAEIWLQRALFGLIFAGAGAVLLAASFEVLALLSLLFVGLALCLGGLMLARTHPGAWRALLPSRERRSPIIIPPLPRRQASFEIGLLIMAAVMATSGALFSPEAEGTPGHELEWLTGYVTLAHDTLRDSGDIPLWNPYYRSGEPAFGSAFSFLSNPISALPGLIFGTPQGIKISITIYAAFAAVGGWYLARTLGFAALGRLFLGLLCLGKGNMHAMLLSGYYQLGVQQAYFPWIIAGAIQTLRTRERLPLAMTGCMVALMFMAGNVWYILPVLISLGVLTAAYTFYRVDENHGNEGRSTLRPYNMSNSINWAGWRRMIYAAGMMLALSAVYTLPVLLHYDHIGSHPDEIAAGQVVVDMGQGVGLYFNDDLLAATIHLYIYAPRDGTVEFGQAQYYYSFVTPAWFVLLIFVIVPPITRRLHRAAQPDHRRLWAAGLLLISLMTMWGLGGIGWIGWLYTNVPVLRGWRFVGRALAMGAFWIGVLVALRVDALWQAMQQIARKNVRLALSTGFAVTCALAAFQVNVQWYMLPQSEPGETIITGCLQQLRTMYPNRDFNVWLYGYNIAAPFIDNRLRMGDIEADYLPLPDANTVGHPFLDLWHDLPPYAVVFSPDPALTYEAMAQFVAEQGYAPWEGSPIVDGKPCLYYHPGHDMPFAFTLPPDSLGNLVEWSALQPLARPVLAYQHLTDVIEVAVEGTDAEQLLLVDTTAYPGWQVTVNGQPANLEIGGGLTGVRLPAAPGQVYQVNFTFRPTEIVAGGILTIVAAGLCIGYLLRLDARWFRR